MLKSSSRVLENARTYCRESLRKYDYPAYLLASFQSAQGLDAYLALRALNVDLALIPDSVSNATVGKMRYQFWTETIDQAYKGTPPAQPIAMLLDHILESGVKLTKPYILRLIAERQRRIDNMNFATLSQLESYAEKTYSTLLYLQLESLDVRRPAIDDIAQHIGLASGICSVLRGYPYYIAKRIMPLPADTCAHHNLKQEDLLRSEGASGLSDAVFEIATRANDHLISAKYKIEALQDADVSRQCRGIFLHAIPSKLFLERLEKSSFNLYEPKLSQKDWRLPYRLWKGA